MEPLEGVRVLDLSSDIPGSYACMLLRDMGGEVVKVEPPGGDPGRASEAYRLWNRGKKSAVVDLGSEGGKRVLELLVKWADVLVETFTAGEARARGLGYEDLSLMNQRLIYCALPPFGESGPLAEVPADDGVVSAYAGIYGEMAFSEETPRYLYIPLASYGTAMLAAYAITVALYVREVTGVGQKVDVPWFNGAVAIRSGNIIVGSKVPPRGRGRSTLGANPIYRLYRCQDGWLLLGCGNHTFWKKLCIALDVKDLAEDPRYAGAPWNIPIEHHQALISRLKGIFVERPRSYWLERLTAYDIPCAPVESRAWFLEHPQVRYNGMMVKVMDEALGQTWQMGVPVKLSRSPGSVKGPAAGVGQHTREVLRALGFSEVDIEGLLATGAVQER